MRKRILPGVYRNIVCVLLIFSLTFGAFIGIAQAGNLTPIQQLVLDGMGLTDRDGFTTLLTDLTSDNLPTTTNAIKSTYLTNMSLTDISASLNELMKHSSIARAAVITVVDLGYPTIGSTASIPNIRSKINSDITGNASDDRVLQLMLRALITIKELTGEALIKDDASNTSKIYFNRLASLDAAMKSRLDNLLNTIISLPISPKNFETFASYYETYINGLQASEIAAFKMFVNGLDGNYGIYVPTTVPGGGGGGGGGGAIAPPASESTPTQNTDGSASVQVPAGSMTLSDGVATATISNTTLDSAFSKAKEDSEGVKTVNITVPPVNGANAYAVTLPAANLTGTAHNQNVELSTG
ncbi:MAG: hypothetical protein K0R31_1715, partial [Clostridiales bacterium]|nr:hypothetical protein [Clostridiales bacterium]